MGHSDILQRIATAPSLLAGTVTDVTVGGIATVRLEFAERTARRAASCLLVPQPGDQVLVGGTDPSELWVIAILERAANVPSRLVVGGDATLEVEGRLAVSSSELVVKASRATALLDEVQAFGRQLTTSIAGVRMVGGVLEAMVDRISLFAETCHRTIRGVDQVRSGCIDHRAETAINLQASEVMATARTLVKIDGGQIHIG